MMWGALVGAAASLIGGASSARAERRAIAAQNEYNKPINVRKRAEEAGFNPLLFVGPGVGQQTAVGGTNFVGQAIADAGMIIGDMLLKTGKGSYAAKLNQYQQQNEKLQQEVQSLTLRPKVGGIYAANETVPTLEEATGNAGNRRDPGAAPGVYARLGFGDLLGPRYNRGDAAINSASDQSSKVPYKDLYAMGDALAPQSGTSDAEAWESRYGEIIAEYEGAKAYLYDKFQNRKKKWVDWGVSLGDNIQRDLGVGKYNPYANQLPLKSWQQKFFLN